MTTVNLIKRIIFINVLNPQVDVAMKYYGSVTDTMNSIMESSNSILYYAIKHLLRHLIEDNSLLLLFLIVYSKNNAGKDSFRSHFGVGCCTD